MYWTGMEMGMLILGLRTRLLEHVDTNFRAKPGSRFNPRKRPVKKLRQPTVISSQIEFKWLI
jgi:hypothetical protein